MAKKLKYTGKGLKDLTEIEIEMAETPLRLMGFECYMIE